MTRPRDTQLREVGKTALALTATRFRRLYESHLRVFSTLLFGIIVFSVGSAANLGQPSVTGTLPPDSSRLATLLAVENTRTAIALTRDPSLATPRTPAPIQVTATAIEAQLLKTATARAQPQAYNDLLQTATAVIAHATETMVALTRNPALALTPSSTFAPVDCTQPALGNLSRTDLANRVQDALILADVGGVFVSVVTFGVSSGTQCQDFSPLETTFIIYIPINELSSEFLATRITRVLSVLERFPTQADFGLEPARLLIRFDYQGTLWVIDTGYENARKAFQEKLTGAKLLEALGYVLSSQ